MGWTEHCGWVLAVGPLGCLSVPDAGPDEESTGATSSGAASATAAPTTESNGSTTQDAATETSTGSSATTQSDSMNSSTGPSDPTTGDVPVTGLVGHWPLDEGSGSVAMDVSGNDLHATLIGSASWVDTLGDGTGVAFLGRIDALSYVEVPDMAPLTDIEQGNYSISAWFQPRSVPSGIQPTFEYGIVVRPGFHRGLAFDADQNAWFDNWIEPSTQVGASSGSLPIGSWYHLVGIFDVDSGRTQLYVDGELAGTEAFDAGAAVVPTDGPWRFGISDPQAEMFENRGDLALDDVRIYDRVLTVEEIESLFFAGP